MTGKRKGKEALLWTLSMIAAVVFALAGIAKLIGLMTEQFIAWGYSPSFAVVVGVLEILGALGLLLPRMAGWSALGLMILMLGAGATHVVNQEELAVIAPALMFVLLGVVVWGRGLVHEPTSAGHVVRSELVGASGPGASRI